LDTCKIIERYTVLGVSYFELHSVADVVVTNVQADATAGEIEEMHADAGPVLGVAIK
jgi:hypothetical protein